MVKGGEVVPPPSDGPQDSYHGPSRYWIESSICDNLKCQKGALKHFFPIVQIAIRDPPVHDSDKSLQKSKYKQPSIVQTNIFHQFLIAKKCDILYS